MRVLALLSLSVACMQCSTVVGTGPSEGGTTSDATSTRDAINDVAAETSAAECVNVRECAGRRRPTDTTFSQGWSCVMGRCTYEPRGGMTCARRADGCASCDFDAVPPACMGTRCIAPLGNGTMVRFEGSNCSRDFVSSIARCEGHFVYLTDGAVCLLTEAPTGAIRYVLSCGPCEVVFTP